MGIPALAQPPRFFTFPAGLQATDYAPDVVVVKLQGTAPAPQARTLSATSAAPLHSIRQCVTPTDIRPIRSVAAQTAARRQPSPSVLDNIYMVRLAPGESLLAAINRLLQLEEVVYAEPYYLMKPLKDQKVLADEYVPSDPEAAVGKKQNYLRTIRAHEAWAIEKGNASELIGILDTGVGLGHQDLMGNLQYNTADPINGVDDDQDGYVDNYLGWDMADNDNDPTADFDKHGTLVTGLAAATTDNGIGIASTGFRSSYVPIKIFSSVDGVFYRGYEAIIYAADQGCRVINLSWGAANNYSSFVQDIINYAVLEKDVVVVAAGGNSGKLENYYPASYDNVLSVITSDLGDNKIASTTHSYFADIMAPGSNIYTTDNHDQYRYESGSSLASPLVAGAAALVRAKYPALSALQVMEKLRLSADDVYAVGNNAQFAEQLGYGRLNMKNALQPLATPAIRMSAMAYRNPVGAYAFAGDSLEITATFTNYFKPAVAAEVTLSSLSPYATVIQGTFKMGALDSLATISNTGQAFTVRLSDTLPVNERLLFRLGIKDGNYQDYQYFVINSSPDYLVVGNDNIQVPVGSDGAISYNPYELFGGTGLLLDNRSLATQIGVVMATDTLHVSDNTITHLIDGERSQDFTRQERLRVSLSRTGDVVTYSAFADAAAPYPLQLRVEQRWLPQRWLPQRTALDAGSYLIAAYRVIGLSADTLRGLHVGLFADWDLGDWQKNRAQWDAVHRMGYVYDDQTYAGVALLTDQPATHHAIDWKGLQGNRAEVGDTFTDTQRFAFLSDSTKHSAGVQGEGNDVAYMVGSRTDTLALYQARTIAFAFLAAPSLEALQQAAQQAAQQYEAYRNQPAIVDTVHVCPGQSALVVPQGGDQFRFYSDPLGEQLLQEGPSYTTGPVQQPHLVYFTNIDQGYESSIRGIQVALAQPEADFSFVQNSVPLSGDTLLADASDNFTLTLQNLSTGADSWQWQLGNGFESTRQHPVARYPVGQYTVSLRASHAAGCTDTLTKTLVVVRRSPVPVVPAPHVCPGGTVTLAASNASHLHFYTDAALQHQVHQGTGYTTGPILSDTSFYVVNVDSVYPSLPQQVRIVPVTQALDIDHVLDTLTTQRKYALRLQAAGDLSRVAVLQWYVDDQAVAAGDSFVYDYGTEHALHKPVNIRLDYAVVQEGTSCQQSVHKIINLTAAPPPQVSLMQNCQTGQRSLVPQEGAVCYFYENEGLDSVVYKGSRLVLSETAPDTFYVTCMDGLKESAPVVVTVSDEHPIDFRMSADTLYLSEHQEVVFEAVSTDEQPVSWQWDTGNGKLVARPGKFTFTYDSAATYTIRLKAQTAEGCEYSAARQLVVYAPTGVTSVPETAAWRIYPNPSSGVLTIEHPAWTNEPLTIRLFTLEGQPLYQQKLVYRQPLSLDLSGRVPPVSRLYLLQTETARHSFFHKVWLAPAQP